MPSRDQRPKRAEAFVLFFVRRIKRYDNRIKRYDNRIKRYDNRIKRYDNRIKRYDNRIKRYHHDVKRLPLLFFSFHFYKEFKKTPTPS